VVKMPQAFETMHALLHISLLYVGSYDAINSKEIDSLFRAYEASKVSFFPL